jgi:hypothetical protein
MKSVVADLLPTDEPLACISADGTAVLDSQIDRHE